MLLAESAEVENIVKSSAEFSLYMMKFSNNPNVQGPMKEIERRIGQILVMAKSVNELNCPFVPLIMHFNK